MIQQLVRVLGGAAGWLLAAVVLVGGGYALYRMGWHDRDQLAITERSQADNDQLRQLLAFADESQVALDDYVLRRGATRVVYRTIREAIPHATTQYRPAPGAPAQPLPQCVFTRAYVSVWNRALGADADVPAASGGAAATTGTAAAAAAAADALGDSGVTQRDILENHVVNAESCTAVRQQLAALIEWHKLAAETLQ